jgi:hypothetical protein
MNALLADLDRRADDGVPPIRAPRRIVGPLTFPKRFSVRPIQLSFVVTTHGAMNVLLGRRVGRDVGVGLDLRHRTDRRVVLDVRAATQDNVVADLHPLSHAGLIPEDHARSDFRAREDDGTGRDDGAVPDRRRRERLALGGRARRERRLLADDGALEHLHALA